MARRRQQAGCLNVSLGCLFFTVISIGSVAVFVNNQRADNQKQMQQLNAQKPVGTLERLQHDLGPKRQADIRGDSIFLTLHPSQGFSSAGTLREIERDITTSLRTIDESGIPFETVEVSAVTSLVDQLGNTRDDTTVYASYDKATIDQINWQNFYPHNVLDIADNKRIHPALKDD